MVLCEYPEHLILVKTLLLFGYTGSAPKNTGEGFLKKTWSLPKTTSLDLKNNNFKEL